MIMHRVTATRQRILIDGHNHNMYYRRRLSVYRDWRVRLSDFSRLLCAAYKECFRADSSDRMIPGTNVQEPFPSLPGLISDTVTITGLLAVCLRNLQLGHAPELAYTRGRR